MNPFLHLNYYSAKQNAFNQEDKVEKDNPGVCFALVLAWLENFFSGKNPNSSLFEKNVELDPQFYEKMKEKQKLLSLDWEHSKEFCRNVESLAKEHGLGRIPLVTKSTNIDNEDNNLSKLSLLQKDNYAALIFFKENSEDKTGHVICIASKKQANDHVIGIFDANYGEIFFHYNSSVNLTGKIATEVYLNQDTVYQKKIKSYEDAIKDLIEFYKEPPNEQLEKEQHKQYGIFRILYFIANKSLNQEPKTYIPKAIFFENVQQTVSSNPTAVGIPHKAPSALSRKGLSAKGKLNHQQLIETLPQDKTWDFGRAIDNGDCFYDAIAQSLHARATNSTHTLKSLRKMCSDYIYQLDKQPPQANWVKAAIEKDKGIDDYQTHLTSVQFTAEEMTSLNQERLFTGYAIWGKPHIEGKILAQQLKISLHIIEFHEAEGGIEAIPPAHMLVTRDKASQVEEKSIHYQDKQMLHLAVYRNHFVPILPSHYLKQQQSNPEVCKQELTQFNKHSLFFQNKENQELKTAPEKEEKINKASPPYSRHNLRAL